MNYIATVTGKVAAGAAQDSAAVLMGLQDVQVTLVPEAPAGLTERGQFSDWLASLSPQDRHRVQQATARWVESLESVGLHDEDPEVVRERLELEQVGGATDWVDGSGDRTYSSAEQALLDHGWHAYRGSWINPLEDEDEEDAVLYSTDEALIAAGIEPQMAEVFPPMWSHLWSAERSRAGQLSPQEAAEFTGMVVYADHEGSLWYGVNGAGYDFYGEHWPYLAYLHGVFHGE